jgi:hypothetical protein
MADEKTPQQVQAERDAAQRKLDQDAAARLDPLHASQQAALAVEPVYRLPNQAESNPGVQGWVFRPHQEKNPGESGAVARETDVLSQQIRSEKEARTRQVAARRERATAQGESWPEPPGPVRLRTHVDISAHAVVDEDKLGAIAQAADALVTALRDAGIEPKANLFGQPL